MINHVRTLLQNTPPGAESDEFVPPDFVPMPTSAAVQKVKRILFSRTPVYQPRIRQIMQMLHATVQCHGYVLAADERITYLPFDNKYLGTEDTGLAGFMPMLETLLTDEDEKELFGDITQEPNKTFYKLWKKHDQLPYKLGGLLLAVVDCTERTRT